jgi:hypothetical protein
VFDFAWRRFVSDLVSELSYSGADLVIVSRSADLVGDASGFSMCFLLVVEWGFCCLLDLVLVCSDLVPPLSFSVGFDLLQDHSCFCVRWGFLKIFSLRLLVSFKLWLKFFSQIWGLRPSIWCSCARILCSHARSSGSCSLIPLLVCLGVGIVSIAPALAFEIFCDEFRVVWFSSWSCGCGLSLLCGKWLSPFPVSSSV